MQSKIKTGGIFSQEANTDSSIYVASHAVYPSPLWAGSKMMINGIRYYELINPMMSDDIVTEEQALQVECMLAEQGDILQKCGNVYLLNPLSQSIDQYFFGVPAIENCKEKVKDTLNKFKFTKDGFLNMMKYDELKMSVNSVLNGIAGSSVNAVNSTLDGIAENAMDTIYFANMWLHLGLSQCLSNRPIVILQSPKYACRQIERYYGIIACMALGITPVQIGGNNREQVYDFEGMADVLPTVDREGRHVTICCNSSRSDRNCYGNINEIYKGLSIGKPLQRLLIVEFREKYKEFMYHLDLALHVDEDQNLYVAKDLLTEESHTQLLEIIGEDRIFYVPKEEWKLYALNFILLDRRYKATKKTAIVRDDCPVLIKQLEKMQYEVFGRKEMFPNGGGSARCRLAFFEKGLRHDIESFLREQCIVEDKLGAGYAVVPRNRMDDFRSVYNSKHLQEIIYQNTK